MKEDRKSVGTHGLGEKNSNSVVNMKEIHLFLEISTEKVWVLLCVLLRYSVPN